MAVQRVRRDRGEQDRVQPGRHVALQQAGARRTVPRVHVHAAHVLLAVHPGDVEHRVRLQLESHRLPVGGLRAVLVLERERVCGRLLCAQHHVRRDQQRVRAQVPDRVLAHRSRHDHFLLHISGCLSQSLQTEIKFDRTQPDRLRRVRAQQPGGDQRVLRQLVVCGDARGSEDVRRGLSRLARRPLALVPRHELAHFHRDRRAGHHRAPALGHRRLLNQQLQEARQRRTRQPRTLEGQRGQQTGEWRRPGLERRRGQQRYRLYAQREQQWHCAQPRAQWHYAQPGAQWHSTRHA